MIYLVVLFAITPALGQVAVSYGIRPDVAFRGDNSRFDVSNIMRYNQKHFKPEMDSQSDEYRRRGSKKRKDKSFNDQLFKDATAVEVDADKEIAANDNKRVDNSWIDVISKNIGNKHIRGSVIKKLEDHVNNLANIIITKLRSMRRFDDFAHHDDMDSVGEADFEKNLQKFRTSDTQRRKSDFVDKLHGFKQTRRNVRNAEREILLHYGFPIHMKIEGFLQKPPQSDRLL